MTLIFILLIRGIQIYSYLLIASVFMSWIPSVKESTIGQWITKVTDPYLNIFRKIIPPIGMIDISPIVAIFVLTLASRGVFTIYQTLFL